MEGRGKMKRMLIGVLCMFVMLTAGICADASEYRSEVKVGLKYGAAAGTETAAADSNRQ